MLIENETFAHHLGSSRLGQQGQGQGKGGGQDGDGVGFENGKDVSEYEERKSVV